MPRTGATQLRVVLLVLVAAACAQGDATEALASHLPSTPQTLVGFGGAQTGWLSNTTYAGELAKAAILTPEGEMKYFNVRRSDGSWNFAPADAIVNFAEQNGAWVRGHVLLWGYENIGDVNLYPDYVYALPAAQLRTEISNHIHTLVGRYRNRNLLAWDVVNEAIKPNGSGIRDSFLKTKLGVQYIDDAFRWAHEADPSALLFYNDFNAEDMGPKADRVFQLAKDLQNRDVPIHGIGLQMHVSAAAPPNYDAIRSNIRRIVGRGLQVHITEMDVKINGLSGDINSKYQAQRSIFRNVAQLCREEPGCTAFLTWGLHDPSSWLAGQGEKPLLFDDYIRRKPAYWGVWEGITGYSRGCFTAESGNFSCYVDSRLAPHVTLIDFDGNAESDNAIYRPSTATWWRRGLPNVVWGAPGDIPVPADYNGDGKTDIAMYRPSNGTWYIYGQLGRQWGWNGPIPVPADYNGDGWTDLAIFDANTGRWYAEGVFFDLWFGGPGDIPVPADYNGDGTAEIAVYRPSNGTWYIYGQVARQWGWNGAIPVPGDYNGDGKVDVAVYNSTNGRWYVWGGVYDFPYGAYGDIPVPGDFNADGKTDIAVFRPSDGGWYVSGQSVTGWGGYGDVPLTLPYR